MDSLQFEKDYRDVLKKNLELLSNNLSNHLWDFKQKILNSYEQHIPINAIIDEASNFIIDGFTETFVVALKASYQLVERYDHSLHQD